MKNFKQVLLMVLSFASIATFQGCGNNSTVPVIPYNSASTAYGNSCGTGYVYSTYGCLPQGNCQAGFGLYNNTCVQGSTGPVANNSCGYGNILSTTYGCIPQGGCPTGYGLYNNACVYASSLVNGSSPTCNAGYVHTVNGCLVQGPCQSGYGFDPLYNMCYPVQ